MLFFLSHTQLISRLNFFFFFFLFFLFIAQLILASLNSDNYYYSDSSKINENEDEYDAGADWSEVAAARAAYKGPSPSPSPTTDASIPESFIVELQATAKQNQINNVIKSSVNNYNSISTTPSIYDFQGTYLHTC